MKNDSIDLTVPDFRSSRPSIHRLMTDIEALSSIHRPQPSDAYHQAIEWVADRAKRVGLQEVTIHSCPADGETMIGTYKALPAWDAEFASLTIMNSSTEVLAKFPAVPVSVATYSRSIDICADIIDVNSGAHAKDYDRKDVQGKLVLAGGPLPEVQREAIFRRGAAGIISYDYVGPKSQGFDQRPNLIGWGQNHPPEGPNGEKSTFAFMISRHQAQKLIKRLHRKAPLKARAIVEGKVHAGKYEMVSGVIKGSISDEFVLCAHLDHVAPSANDNASGVAVLLETAKILGELENKNLRKNARSVRFLFGPEVIGPLSYLSRDVSRAQNIVGALVLDMVGADTKKSGACLTGYPPPHSCPAPWGVLLEEGMHRYVGRHLNLYNPIYSEGGDDYVFSDSSFGIPSVRLTDWPYPFIHTNRDTPDKLCPAKLRDVTKLSVYMVSLATSRDQQVGRYLMGKITEAAVAKIQAHTARNSSTGRPHSEKQDKHLQLCRLAARSADQLKATASRYNGLEDILSNNLKKLFETVNQRPESPMVVSASATPPTQDTCCASRIPKRISAVTGPMRPFFYDFPAGIYGMPHYRQTLPLFREVPSVVAYEALNFVDGHRSVQEIGDLVSDCYHPVKAKYILEYFLILEQAGVLEFLPPR